MYNLFLMIALFFLLFFSFLRDGLCGLTKSEEKKSSAYFLNMGYEFSVNRVEKRAHGVRLGLENIIYKQYKEKILIIDNSEKKNIDESLEMTLHINEYTSAFESAITLFFNETSNDLKIRAEGNMGFFGDYFILPNEKNRKTIDARVKLAVDIGASGKQTGDINFVVGGGPRFKFYLFLFGGDIELLIPLSQGGALQSSTYGGSLKAGFSF